MKLTPLLSQWLAASIVVVACSLTMAQCETCNDGCGGGACEGRCHYCVDGECTPNRTTYGYYETNWRRWPISAPAVPERPKRRRQGPDVGPGEVDLPSPEDETEIRPEFSRLRKRGNPNAVPINEMPYDYSPMDGIDRTLESEVPQSIMPELDGDDTMPRLEVPPADLEGSLFDGAQRRSTSAIRQTSATTPSDRFDNPLRAGITPAIQVSATQPVKGAPRMLAPSLRMRSVSPLRNGNSVRESNPLR